MSVVRTCIRISTVCALRGRTWALGRVFDSRNVPLDEAMQQEPKPWVAVFTDMDRSTITGRDINAGNRELHLICEMGIAAPLETEEGGPVVRIPSSDAGYERVIDMMEHQVRFALFHDPNNKWGELLRRMILEVTSIEASRAGEAERGARWAARYIDFRCDTISDPLPGVPVGDDHPVKKFIEYCRSDEDQGLLDVADLVEASFAGDLMPNWQQALATMSFTEDETRGIGVAPPYATPATEVLTTQVGFTDRDRTTAANIDERDNKKDLKVIDEPVLVLESDGEQPV